VTPAHAGSCTVTPALRFLIVSSITIAIALQRHTLAVARG